MGLALDRGSALWHPIDINTTKLMRNIDQDIEMEVDLEGSKPCVSQGTRRGIRGVIRVPA